MSISSEFDVIILGAGPAGSVLAERLCRRGYRVAIIELRSFPRYAVGESLPPSVELLLKKVGILRHGESLDFPVTTGYSWVWGSSRLSFTPHDAQRRSRGHQVERAGFDAILLGRASRAGASVFQDWRTTELEHHASGWRIVLRSATDERQMLRCRFLCDATGRARVLARKLRLPLQKHSNLIGLVGYWALAPGGENAGHNTLVESVPDGWCYTAQLGGGRRMAGFMTDRNLLPSNLRSRAHAIYSRALAGTRHVKRRLTGATLEGEVRIFAANPTLVEPCCGPDWLLVGDAASTLDPLCSQGVQKAIASALAAATVIHTLLKHPERTEAALEFYGQRERHGFATHLAALSKYYRREERWKQRPFWKTRATEAVAPRTSRRQGKTALTATDRLLPAFDTSVRVNPVVEGEFIEQRPVVFAPGVPRGVRYCSGICVPDLFPLLDGASVDDVLPRYLTAHPRTTAAEVRTGLARLLEMGIVTTIPPAYKVS